MVTLTLSSAKPPTLTFPSASGVDTRLGVNEYSGWIDVQNGIGCAGVLPADQEEGKMYVIAELSDVAGHKSHMTISWYCHN